MTWVIRQEPGDPDAFAELHLADVKLVVWQDRGGAWVATLPGYQRTLRPLAATTLAAAQDEALGLLREWCGALDLALAEVGA